MLQPGVTLYVPLILAVDTDDPRLAAEAAEIYVEGAVDGESTKLVLPLKGMHVMTHDVATMLNLVPDHLDWE